MTSSATERELAKGELKTAIPALAAASRSTWLVPMQKQPMVRSYRRQGRYKRSRLVIATGKSSTFHTCWQDPPEVPT